MRLIDLDAIMAQFPDADFDGDVIENMKAYPYWKIGIDGLINILKDVPIIEQSEDCISRQEALKYSHIEYDDDGVGHRVIYAEDIEKLSPVTPTSDAEDKYDLGYNCGYADAMCDIAESEEEK